MKQVKIVSVYGQQGCSSYDCEKWEEILSQTPWESIEDKEYNRLLPLIHSHNLHNHDKLYVVTPKTVSETQLILQDTIKRLEEQEKKRQDRIMADQLAEANRKSRLAESATARKKKQLAKLQRELGLVEMCQSGNGADC